VVTSVSDDSAGSRALIDGGAEAARRLSGYLNGTHRGRRYTPAAIRESIDSMRQHQGATAKSRSLGVATWSPSDGVETRLRSALAESLYCRDVVELILFGSLARGSATGFSDVDALLVIAEAAAIDPLRLHQLRRRIFAAGRAVLTFNAMQHHGFVIVTPQLLQDLTAATMLPAEALGETRSLFGRTVDAVIGPDETALRRLDTLAANLIALKQWPRHTWALHRVIAMFELAPALYLQATGRPVSKHASFAMARAEFEDSWAPYDVLQAVRERWTRSRMLTLEALATSLRNPWTASRVWRRLPMRPPREAARLLDSKCLVALQRVLGMMLDARSSRVSAP
jgi:predicted nucleotidyltransferase